MPRNGFEIMFTRGDNCWRAFATGSPALNGVYAERATYYLAISALVKKIETITAIPACVIWREQAALYERTVGYTDNPKDASLFRDLSAWMKVKAKERGGNEISA